MPVDAYTIGSSPAAVNLMQILQEIGDEGLQSAVTTFIHLFSRDLNALQDVTDTNIRRRFVRVLVKTTHANVDATEWPQKVKSHVKTVCFTRSRKCFT